MNEQYLVWLSILQDLQTECAKKGYAVSVATHGNRSISFFMHKKVGQGILVTDEEMIHIDYPEESEREIERIILNVYFYLNQQ